MRRGRDENGQVAAELVAVVPVVICVLLAAGQLAVAGYALWTAGAAARAGARAAHVGGSAERAARSALPSWLERDARIVAGGPVEVELKAPALLPGVPAIPVEAAAALEPAGAVGG